MQGTCKTTDYGADCSVLTIVICYAAQSQLKNCPDTTTTVINCSWPSSINKGEKVRSLKLKFYFLQSQKERVTHTNINLRPGQYLTHVHRYWPGRGLVFEFITCSVYFLQVCKVAEICIVTSLPLLSKVRRKHIYQKYRLGNALRTARTFSNLRSCDWLYFYLFVFKDSNFG